MNWILYILISSQQGESQQIIEFKTQSNCLYAEHQLRKEILKVTNPVYLSTSCVKKDGEYKL